MPQGGLFVSLLDGATLARDELLRVEQRAQICGLVSVDNQIWQILFAPHSCLLLSFRASGAGRQLSDR